MVKIIKKLQIEPGFEILKMQVKQIYKIRFEHKCWFKCFHDKKMFCSVTLFP